MMLLGVLGNPVEHSRSPEIHQAFAQAANISLVYQKELVPSGEFTTIARRFLETADGFNVTVPNKVDAFELVDQRSPDADAAQAVNTVEKLPDGTLKGHNTDGPGLINDLTVNLEWVLRGKRILIIGAGGAVRGVLGNILEEQPARVDVYNRTYINAVDLVGHYSSAVLSACKAMELEKEYDLIISGSSAGLSSVRGGAEIPEQVVGAGTRCYDMIYSKELTPFLNWCKLHHCLMVSDGLGMLVEQAALAFEIWTGTKVASRPVLERLR